MSTAEPLRRRVRRPTTTSTFGVGRRESHDASGFYRRFTAPILSDDDDVCPPVERRGLDRVFLGDIRDCPDALAPRSVALVVTSPPYYSGKAYETAVGEGHVPASYTEYLTMLTGVFAACAEALEPGGRIAVNVANLGRKPYRSLSADVITILEGLGLLLRGEIVWQKAKGAAGNCAWGTYQRPGDPVLRDLTERVVVASKGRFDRAIAPAERAARGYPSEASIFRDEFLEATVDLWEMAPESATRVGHPAPFPVELPQRLIDLYTYRDDLVLDPFMGSGTTAVAALRTDRHFVGFDTDAGYVSAALERIETERARLARQEARGATPWRPVLPAVAMPAARQVTTVAPATPDAAGDGTADGASSAKGEESFHARGLREGRRAREVAKWAIEEAGFTVTAESRRLEAGVEVHFVAEDGAGREWLFDVVGAFTSTRAGLQRADALWKAVGKATVASQLRKGTRYVLLATEKPAPHSTAGRALAAVTGAEEGRPLYDVIELGSPADFDRLRSHASAGQRSSGRTAAGRGGTGRDEVGRGGAGRGHATGRSGAGGRSATGRTAGGR